ncbi:hypothetical protein HK098_007802 [Nowakowskiella sp. JEL0407]|nr:hypothetical protein HK098_007802 [Nowakowskiella sp. JEL0407]
MLCRDVIFQILNYCKDDRPTLLVCTQVCYEWAEITLPMICAYPHFHTINHLDIIPSTEIFEYLEYKRRRRRKNNQSESCSYVGEEWTNVDYEIASTNIIHRNIRAARKFLKLMHQCSNQGSPLDNTTSTFHRPIFNYANFVRRLDFQWEETNCHNNDIYFKRISTTSDPSKTYCWLYEHSKRPNDMKWESGDKNFLSLLLNAPRLEILLNFDFDLFPECFESVFMLNSRIFLSNLVEIDFSIRKLSTAKRFSKFLLERILNDQKSPFLLLKKLRVELCIAENRPILPKPTSSTSVDDIRFDSHSFDPEEILSNIPEPILPSLSVGLLISLCPKLTKFAIKGLLNGIQHVIEQLIKMPIREIEFEQCDLEETLPLFYAHQTLKSVSFQECTSIDDEALAPFLASLNLESIALKWTMATTNSIRALLDKNSIPIALSKLVLHQAIIEPLARDLLSEHLPKCKYLYHLDIFDTTFDSFGIKSFLQQCGNQLKFLRLVNGFDGVNVDDEIARIISSVGINLEFLDLGYSDITDAGVLDLVNGATQKIRELKFYFCNKLTEISVNRLLCRGESNELRRLDLRRTGILKSKLHLSCAPNCWIDLME